MAAVQAKDVKAIWSTLSNFAMEFFEPDIRPLAKTTAEKTGASVVIFGHTHVPLHEALEIAGRTVLYVNVGAMCSDHCFAEMDLGKEIVLSHNGSVTKLPWPALSQK